MSGVRGELGFLRVVLIFHSPSFGSNFQSFVRVWGFVRMCSHSLSFSPSVLLSLIPFAGQVVRLSSALSSRSIHVGQPRRLGLGGNTCFPCCVRVLPLPHLDYSCRSLLLNRRERPLRAVGEGFGFRFGVWLSFSTFSFRLDLTR